MIQLMLDKKFKDNKTLPIYPMSQTDLSMRLSVLSLDLETISKVSPFFTKKSSTTFSIRINNTL